MNDGVKVQEVNFEFLTCFSCCNLDLDKDTVQEEVLKSLRSWPIKSEFTLPCGNTISTDQAIEHLEKEFTDLPCPCGDPNHWLIQVDYKGKEA